MTNVSVKTQYAQIYEGEHFEGELKSQTRIHHGAWICEVYLPENRVATVFRLGHLDRLLCDGVDLLAKARTLGWNSQVASDAQQVTTWTARDRVWDMIHTAGQPPAEESGMVMSNDPGQGEWEALENNLGRRPAPKERALFESEFKKVLRDPSSTNEWPEG
jgi:hypothetical protein